jgi:hypothetical protein
MPLSNMSKNSAAHQKKVKSAMWILQTTTGVKVLQAMILAWFLKLDVPSKTVHQAVKRRHQQKQNKACMGQPAPIDGVVIISKKPSLLELTVVADPTKRHKPNPHSLLIVVCPIIVAPPSSSVVVIILIVIILVPSSSLHCLLHPGVTIRSWLLFLSGW